MSLTSGPPEPRSRWLDAAGVRMHARVVAPAGSQGRPPLVLVHGVGVSSRYMVPLARTLGGRGLAVSAPDLPGFGRSQGPRRPLDVRGLADALGAWIDAAGLDHPVVVANSFGCQVAVDLAAGHPGLMPALVLLGPTMDPRAPGLGSQLLRLLGNSRYEPPSLAWILLRDYLDCGPRRVLATARHGLRHRVHDKLPRVTAPTLVLRGGRDRLVSQAWAEQVTRLLPQGRLVVLTGRGHTLNFNAPLEVADEVEAFVERTVGQEAPDARQP